MHCYGQKDTSAYERSKKQVLFLWEGQSIFSWDFEKGSSLNWTLKSYKKLNIIQFGMGRNRLKAWFFNEDEQYSVHI